MISLLKFSESEKLREIIVADAAKLKVRQETDTIDIVDDLRYAINEMANPLEKAGAQKSDPVMLAWEQKKKLEFLDDVLFELGLKIFR